MENCKIPVYLAYAMATYTLASLLYLMLTRNIGTPLRDSYTNEQLQIKHESAYIRSKIFYTSLGISMVILLLIKPFHKCLPTE